MLNKRVLRPIEYPDLIRLGNNKDGGYVVPEPQVHSSSYLISLGISDDWSFEQAFLKKNPEARLLGFDHSIGPRLLGIRFLKSLPQAIFRFMILDWKKGQRFAGRAIRALKYFLFFTGERIHIRKKVSDVDNEHKTSINGIIRSLHLSEDQTVFLKMDIEGSEYRTITDIIKNENKITCIAAEFHYLNTQTDIFNEAIARLLNHYHIVHIHGNNGGIYDAHQDFPETVEITFLHKTALNHPPAPSTRRYPVSGLDFPNDSKKPDYELRFE